MMIAEISSDQLQFSFFSEMEPHLTVRKPWTIGHETEQQFISFGQLQARAQERETRERAALDASNGLRALSLFVCVIQQEEVRYAKSCNSRMALTMTTRLHGFRFGQVLP